MIKQLIPYFTVLLLLAASCKRTPVELQIDDLEDKTEYTGGIAVTADEYNGYAVSELLINGERHNPDEPMEIFDAGYYSIDFKYSTESGTIQARIRIVILDEERGSAEWGLKKWIPQNAVYQKEPGIISMIYPAEYPEGVKIPVIFIAGNTITQVPANLHVESGETKFNIKKGVGSWMFSPGELSTPLKIGDQDGFKISASHSGQSPEILKGNLSGDTILLEKSMYRITEDLLIPAHSSLVIQSGAFLSVDPGVNIFNSGTILIKGSPDDPVTITCSSPGQFWGGFISTGEGNSIHAEHSIICLSGFNTGDDFSYGHAKRQALFYMEDGELSLQNCYMNDHAGQVFYPINSIVNISGCLVQRAKTGGQINQSELEIRNSVFTDFPDDGSTYQDEDNDGLYIMGSNAVIEHSFFMYAKDDGLDSGGSEGGTVLIRECSFEAVFHEGAALSSGGNVVKSHTFIRCTFENCGQGIELGYSSPNHHVVIDSCMFTGNNIGIRYGDNYTSQHEGTMFIKNSYSILNYDKDIWNMLRNNWNASISKMQFENVTVSMPNELYPDLQINE